MLFPEEETRNLVIGISEIPNDVIVRWGYESESDGWMDYEYAYFSGETPVSEFRKNGELAEETSPVDVSISDIESGSVIRIEDIPLEAEIELHFGGSGPTCYGPDGILGFSIDHHHDGGEVEFKVESTSLGENSGARYFVGGTEEVSESAIQAALSSLNLVAGDKITVYAYPAENTTNQVCHFDYVIDGQHLISDDEERSNAIQAVSSENGYTITITAAQVGKPVEFQLDFSNNNQGGENQPGGENPQHEIGHYGVDTSLYFNIANRNMGTVQFKVQSESAAAAGNVMYNVGGTGEHSEEDITETLKNLVFAVGDQVTVYALPAENTDNWVELFDIKISGNDYYDDGASRDAALNAACSETGLTFTVTAAEAGKQLEFQINFTDQQRQESGGNEQGGGNEPGSNEPGNNEPGNNEPSNNEPGGPQESANPAEVIPAHGYAYYIAGDTEADREELLRYFTSELWYEFFIPACPYGYDENFKDVFENEDDLFSNIELETEKSIDAATGLECLAYVVNGFPEGTVVTGYILLLTSKNQYIVKTGDEYHVVNVGYYYVDSTDPDRPGEKDRFSEDSYVFGDIDDIKVFGNGTCMAGPLQVGSENAEGFHITQEHSGIDRDEKGFEISGLSNRLVVCKKDASVAKITGERTAAAWNFVNVDVYDIGTISNPSVAEIFYGSESIKLCALNKAITAVAVDTSKMNADAVSVTAVDGGFEVAFLTAYDNIPLLVTFANGTTGAVEIHRVGLNITDNDVFSQVYVNWHGTDHSVRYSSEEANSTKAIVATFYYNTGKTKPTEKVNLFVTITTKDGVIRKVITDAITFEGKLVENGNPNALIGDGTDGLGYASQGSDCYYDDYLLWEGTNAEYQDIVKVEAFVYDAGDEDSFGGMKVGSGAGVVWTPSN